MRSITLDTIVPLVAGLALLGASLMHSIFEDTAQRMKKEPVVNVSPLTANVSFDTISTNEWLQSDDQ
jgi:hypothetical protein